MKNARTIFLINTAFFLLVLVLLAYIVLRAACVDMTHDEAYSFYNAKIFWWVETLCTGNTHWFNFIAIKTCIFFGLEKTIYLRGFSLLCSFLFLLLVWVFIKKIENPFLKIFAFSFLLLNPFLIDYLALARGYSAGLLFECASLFYAYLYLNNKNIKAATASLFLAGLSAIANFNFFYFFTAYALLHFYTLYFKNRQGVLKNKLVYIEIIFTGIIVGVVLKALSFITNCSNDIGNYGGTNFISSVFSGFIDSLLYKQVKLNFKTLYIIAVLFFVLVLLAVIIGVFRRKKHNNHLYFFAAILLAIMFVLVIINKWCFGVLYPTYRTTFMFYPLITLVLVGFFANLKAIKIKNGLLLMMSLGLIINFLGSINVKSTFDYTEQVDAKKVFYYADRIGAKSVGISPELYGVFRNYYQQTNHFKFSFNGYSINANRLRKSDSINLKLKALDYLILFPPYNFNFYKAQAINLKPIKYYQTSGTLLLKVL
jgi:hypothetical protein